MKVHIRPFIAPYVGVEGHREIAELAAEPSLFRCSMEHAEAMGGPITKEILAEVRAQFKADMHSAYAAGLTEVIDVRVQRLMPGMYPSIPGWHCDAVPRKHYHAQPDFSLINPNTFHITCIVDTDPHGVSDTEYLGQDFMWEYDDGEPIWKQLHQYIERAGHTGRAMRAGDLIKFNSMTPHRARPCHRRGWRLFFRMSMYHNPPVANGVPNAQQVYILSEENGW